MKIRTVTAASVTGLLGRPMRLPPGMSITIPALEFQSRPFEVRIHFSDNGVNHPVANEIVSPRLHPRSQPDLQATSSMMVLAKVKLRNVTRSWL
jgi:hypothetical protein